MQQRIADSNPGRDQSRDRPEFLLSKVPAIVYACSARPPHGATYIGRGVKALLGYEADEFVREPEFWIEHIHPDDISSAIAELQKVFEAGNIVVRYRFRHRDGRYRWLRDDVRLVKDENGREEMVGCRIDITDHRQAEEALVATEKMLTQQRLELEQLVEERTAALKEAVGELDIFSYSIAHEMRAPLRSMSTFAQSVLNNYSNKLGAEAVDFLQRICRSSKRLDRLIQDALDYEKLLGKKIVMQSVDLNDLVRDMIGSYPGWQLPIADVQVEGKLSPVHGNPAFLTQCISNILSNAVKFIHRGCVPRIRIRSQPAGEQVRLWIQDNGIGIAKDHQARIFQMFEHIHPATEYEGTGIGLTIARKAVQRMGGTIGVASELGKGSSFWIELRKG